MSKLRKMWKKTNRFVQLGAFLLAGTVVWGVIPENLRNDNPILSAIYGLQPFQGEESHVPHPPAAAREKLAALALSDPQNAEVYEALADLDVQLLDFSAAETHLRQYIEKSADKDRAYSELENYYHSQLRFDAELKAIVEHAKASKAAADDIGNNTGPYSHYRRAIQQIQKYGLPDDPLLLYKAIIDTYPDQRQPYLDFIVAVKDKDKERAKATLDVFQKKFPEDLATALRARASLLPPEEAFTLLDKSFQPVWDSELLKLHDSYAVSTGKKGAYLDSLKERFRKNPLDFDATVRLFYAYHLSGSQPEAQNVLNDFRLLKDQDTKAGKASWTTEELYVMARLSHLLLNYNEEARYYYSLYTQLRGNTKETKVSADDALFGLFQVAIAADQRALQIGEGNIDYYKDIATADPHPGFLNGILSLLFNSTDPASEWESQKPRVLAYNNRALALRILRIVQRENPQSAHLPAMYRDALKVYDKYAMNELIVQAGQEFFRNYLKTPEILDVAVSVTDAYSRMQDYENEWKTYEFILPISAAMESENLIASALETTRNTYDEEEEDEYYEEDAAYSDEKAEVSSEDTSWQTAKAPDKRKSSITYESLLNRYISSLTQQKKHMEVVALYKNQITQHPGEEGLYENFASYLASNNLLDEEVQVYQQAIQQFQQRSWYEKLARWYIRRERLEDLETVSRQIIDTFEGTEVASYLQNTIPGYANPYRALYVALNKYAHDRFPYHLGFVRNLMGFYSSTYYTDWASWEQLAQQYYYLDGSIRNEYLAYLSSSGRLPADAQPTNAIEKRFAADVKIWRSHFEQALPIYGDLSKDYPSERPLNILLADLTRSLGAQDPANYPAAAAVRERLAKIEPSDSALWTTAGETMADVEAFDAAKAYWQNILRIDPRNENRYLEVATILWDYYLFDDALATIEQARKIKEDPELFAYEAGAIQESKRNYDAAIAEYSKSLLQYSEEANSRLTELYKRPRLTARVRTVLEQRLKDNPQDSNWWTGVIDFYTVLREREIARDLMQRAVATLPPQEFRRASTSLKQTASTLGFVDIQEQLMQLEVKRAEGELRSIELTLDLARFYEGQKQNAKAEAAYKELYNEHPRSAGVINALISYYWRSEKYAAAFGMYREILPAANENYRKQYLLESANRYIERKDYAPALAAVQQLTAQDPSNMQYFQLTAEIYAGQQNFSALTEHYKKGLESARNSNLPADQKKAQIAALRRGIISANLILKDYAAALDQYIEILNRDAESEEVLRETAEFAWKYGVFDRLVTYYQNTAQASPKDHRWPMVLGRLHFFSGEFDPAIADFQNAIAIRPERKDLRQQLAESFQRVGRYQDALTAFEKLYVLSYKDQQWLHPMAELHARLGNTARALELYAQTRPTNESGMDRNFGMAKEAMEWSLPAEAAEFGAAAMKEYYTDMSQTFDSFGFQKYIEALVRSGHPQKAFEVLYQTYEKVTTAQTGSTFDTEELRSTAYTVQDTMTRHFPQLIQKYLTGDQVQALDASLFAPPFNARSDWKVVLFLPLVRNAGMARAEEQLLRDLINENRGRDESPYRSYRGQLRDFYRKRMAFARGAQWLEKEWRSKPDERWREDLPDIADFYRLAGNHDNELKLLREYYKFHPEYVLELEPVERYLALLYERDLQDELNQVASSGHYMAANYFIKRKDKERTLLAVESLAKGRSTVWRAIQRGMAGREFRDPAPAFAADFRSGLDIRTIGALLEEHGDESTSLFGDDWFYYGTRFGEHLWWSGTKEEAARFLPSDLEGAPTAAVRQAALAAFYMSEKDYTKALEHFTFAAQLDSDWPEYIDQRAQSLWLTGKKEEALALWKDMISSRKAPRFELLVESAIEYAFLQSVKADVEEFLQKRLEQSGTSGLTTLLPLYLGAVPQEAPELIAKWISVANDSKELGGLLLMNQELSAESRLQIYRAVSSSLKQRMLNATGSDRYSHQTSTVSWNLRFVREMLDTGNPQQALTTCRETLEFVEPNSRSQDDFQLEQAKALIRTGNKEEAVAALLKYAERKTEESPAFRTEEATTNMERYQDAFELMEAEGLESESRDLQEKMYEDLIVSGQTANSNYLGLARVKLQKGLPEEAKRLLNRMIYASAEYLEGFHLAAELMEEQDRLEDAIAYRAELAKRSTRDIKNLAQLAQDLSESGKGPEAAKIAERVVQSNAATVDERVQAANVYGASATALVGPPELQEIERVSRGGAASLAASNTYYRNYRAVVLEKVKAPQPDILLAQKYLQPVDEDLDQQLFQAYRSSGQCELSMIVIDPDQVSLRETYQPPQYNEYTGEYYDYSSYYNPVEKMDLDEKSTAELALQMAECAQKQEEHRARLYFLQMAVQHTMDSAGKQNIIRWIDEAEQQVGKEAWEEEQRWKIQENIGRES